MSEQPTKPMWPTLAPFGFEYVEEFPKHASPWSDLLERYAREGWRLAFVLHDESSDDASSVRIIFERPRQGPEDALGWPAAQPPMVARVPEPTPVVPGTERQRTRVGVREVGSVTEDGRVVKRKVER